MLALYGSGRRRRAESYRAGFGKVSGRPTARRLTTTPLIIEASSVIYRRRSPLQRLSRSPFATSQQHESGQPRQPAGSDACRHARHRDRSASASGPFGISAASAAFQATDGSANADTLQRMRFSTRRARPPTIAGLATAAGSPAGALANYRCCSPLIEVAARSARRTRHARLP